MIRELITQLYIYYQSIVIHLLTWPNQDFPLWERLMGVWIMTLVLLGPHLL